MGLFSRLGTLLKSNLNDLISKAEDPEKMLQQVLAEMQKQLIESKKQVAMAIADEKRLQKQLEVEQDRCKEWERKAMLAVRAGDDGLAKEALLRKQEHETIAAQYQQQWMAQKAAVDKLKDALRMLSNKIEEARRKKNVLIARKKRAEAQASIANTMSGLSDNSAFETFDRMSHKIDELEAEASAGAELANELGAGETDLESRFRALEEGGGGNVEADMALADLKAKMGIEAPKPTRGALPSGSTTFSDEDMKELEELGLSGDDLAGDGADTDAADEPAEEPRAAK